MMIRLEFVAICVEFNIDPEIALENINVVEAIKACDVEKLKHILMSEF